MRVDEHAKQEYATRVKREELMEWAAGESEVAVGCCDVVMSGKRRSGGWMSGWDAEGDKRGRRVSVQSHLIGHHNGTCDGKTAVGSGPQCDALLTSLVLGANNFHVFRHH